MITIETIENCENCRITNVANGNKVENVVFAIEAMLLSHELTVREYREVLKCVIDRLDGHIDKCVMTLDRDF